MNTLVDIGLNGGALGCAYALIALAFVVTYKATGVLNLAQGGIMLVGAYTTYSAHQQWHLPFWLAMVTGVAAGAFAGWLIQAAVLRFMIGRGFFAQILVTFGLLYIMVEIGTATWGSESLDLGTPWGNSTVRIAGASIPEYRIWTIVLTAIAVLAFFVFFKFSRLGLSMRATAFDQEAALAQGISPRRVYAVSWAVSGAVAALSAIMLTANPGGLDPSLQAQALLAFPAIILGGMDSPGGAVLAGLVVGVTQNLAAQYLQIGSGFSAVFPYVVMLAVLLIRPYGIFGTPEVRRI